MFMLAHLDTLLSALRQAGLHVGISEVLRLQQVFARQPECVSGDDAVAQEAPQGSVAGWPRQAPG